MAKHTSSLDMLIDLATDERDAAAEALGHLRSAEQQAQNQLDALLNYRSEYAQRLAEALSRGMSVTSLHNYRRFVAALDQAIEQQRDTVSSSQQQVDDGKSRWQSRQRRLKSFDVLNVRRRQAEEATEARREQYKNDEYAHRASRTPSHFRTDG